MNIEQRRSMIPDDFQNIIATSLDGFMMVDMAGTILEVNASYCQLVGYTREELLTMHLSTVDTNDDQEVVEQRIAEIQTLGSLRFETSHRHKDGTVINLEVSTNYSPSHSGTIFSFLRDISPQKRTGDILAARLRLLEYSLNHSLAELLRQTLDEAEELTGSSIGFYHFIDADNQTLTLHAWSTRTATMLCKAEGSGSHYPVSKAGVWVDCLQERRPVIHNDYASLPNRKGMPEGHVTVVRELVVPVLRNDRIVAILGVGNKKSDYDQRDVEMVSILADLAWGVAEHKLLNDDLQRQEEALHESRLNFRALFEKGPIGVAYHRMVYDETGKPVNYFFLDANQSYQKLTGVNPVGKLVTEAFPGIENDPFDWIGTFGKVVQTGQEIRFQKYLQTNDRWYDCVGYQYKPDHFVAAFMEITDSKRAEMGISRLSELLNELQRIAGVGGWEIDLATNTVYWTDETYRICEISPAEYTPTVESGIAFYAPESIPVITAAVQEAIEFGKDYDLELSLMTAKGRRVLVRTISKVYQENGKVTKIRGSFKDITKRKQAEEALAHSHRLMSYIIEHTRSAVAVHDRDLRYIYVSQRYLDEYGIKEKEVIGKHHYEVFPDLPQKWRDVHQRALLGEVVSADDDPYYRDDGSVEWTRWDCRPWFASDGSIGGIIVYTEVTTERKKAEDERLKLERQLLHAQKLESLGVLAGGIAHDFNNLLMAIMGNADLALMRLNPESPAVGNLHAIEQASARAADLAKQMLAYSGKGKFVVESLDLNRLLDEMLHMLEVSISKKAVLRFNQYQPLPTVEADATQMRQIVMNLVINASEAIGDRSGVIAITTGCMDCDRSYLKNVWFDENLTDGLYVYLEIADSGCGMDKQTLAKLFDPFFTTKFTGRGLGMSAVLGIVRGHKGAIRVYSEPGKGTTFKVLLPASGRPAELFNGTGHKDDWKGSGIVLLVDDEETVRGIGVEMLKELGFDSITANDGREAVEQFKSNPAISFVILDLTMPHMDGEQCFRELRQIKPDVKVIMSSGFSEDEVTGKFMGKGLAGFIQKPYKLSTLKEAIQGIEQEGR